MAQLGEVAQSVIQSKEALRQSDAYKFLNQRQFDAVTYPLRSFLVLAGAGTGKTSVLINRFRYLIEELNVDPKAIMGVTFTNKAAKEIRHRLFGVFKHNPEKANLPTIGTFHSICLKMLRDYARYAGIAQNYTIWNTEDAEEKMLDIARNGYPRPKGYLTRDEQAIESERGFVPPYQYLEILIAAINRAKDKVKYQMQYADEKELMRLNMLAMQLDNAGTYYGFLNHCASGKKTVKYDEVKVNIGSSLARDISFFKENGWKAQQASEKNRLYYDVVNLPEIGHFIPKFMFDKFNVDRALRYLALVVYRDFELYSQDNHLLDFSDLLMLSVNMLEENPAVRELVRKDYKAIMVDEFQDTNMLQYRWLKLIAGEDTSVMVVGDDDQSIYGWRGAHPEYMQYFLVDFAHPRSDDFSDTTRKAYMERRNQVTELEIVRLEQNYRSTTNILSAANDMIGLNTDRLGKELFTKKTEFNPLIDTLTASDEFALAKWIAQDIKNKIKESHKAAEDDPNVKPLKFEDFAVLYRTNQLGTKASSMLSQQNVPHVVYGGYSFYKRKPVKMALEWLNFVLDMENDLLFTKTFQQIAPSKRVNPFAPELSEADKQKGKINGFIPKLLEELDFERDRSALSRYVEALTAIAMRFENEVAVMTGNFDNTDVDPFWVSPYATTQGMLTCEFHHSAKVTKVAQSISDYAKYLERLLEIISNNHLSLHQAVFDIWKACGLWDFYHNAALEEQQKEAEEQAARRGKSTNAAKVGEAVRSFEYLEDLLEQIKTWEKDQLENSESDYGSMVLEDKLLAYLNDVMLYTDKDESRKQEIDVVKMMTLHAAKGLEFKHVYLYGVSADVFPSKMTEAIEEERRLFYVGITRAREHLTVTAFGQESLFFKELGEYSFAVLNHLGDFSAENIDRLMSVDDKNALPYRPENRASSGVMSLQKKNADQVVARHNRFKSQNQSESKPRAITENRMLGLLAGK